MKTMSYAERFSDWNLISISRVSVSNGDCCVKSATGNVMRNERDALGVSGKFVRRKMPLKENMKLSVAGQVDSPTDTNETAPGSYDPYDHMPATLHDAAETNHVVKLQSIRTDAE